MIDESSGNPRPKFPVNKVGPSKPMVSGPSEIKER
jgi:hypothetical protein